MEVDTSDSGYKDTCGSRKVTASKKKKVYKQKFRPSWLSEEEFKRWLKAPAIGSSKPSCSVCNSLIAPAKTAIFRHGKCASHLRALSMAAEEQPELELSRDPAEDLQMHPDSKISSFLSQNNLPVSLSAPLTDLIKSTIPSNSGEVVVWMEKVDNAFAVNDGGVATVEDSANTDTGLSEQSKLCAKDNKKRRISEAFSSASAEKKSLGLKKLKIASEEERLQASSNLQPEVNTDLKIIKDLLKKTQKTLEKIALLKKAKLKLLCAKYGIEFDDLFD